MRGFARNILLLSSWLLCLQLSFAYAAEPDYTLKIRKAEQLLKQAKYIEAFTVAREAINIDAGRATAFYIAGMALYRQDMLDEAQKHAEGALLRSTSDVRPAVEKLLDDVAKKQLFYSKVREGDKALVDKMHVVAAASYTQAWRAVSAREDIGLKAARIWAQLTPEPIEAARIYRELLSSQDELVRQEARDRLVEMSASLKKVGREKEKEAKALYAQGRKDAALQAFSSAVLADPKSSAYVDAADILAEQRKRDEAIVMLKRGAQEGAVQADRLFAKPHLRVYAQDPVFVAFVAEALGPSALADASELSRQARDLTGMWRLADAEARLHPYMRVVQHGPRVVVEETDSPSIDGKVARLKFEGYRTGNRLSGILLLYQDAKRCRSKGIVEKMETIGEISEDGTRITLQGGEILKGFGIFGIGCNKGIDQHLEAWEKSGVKYLKQ